MSVQVEKLEKSMVKLTITVPAADFVSAMKKAYNKQKKSLNVPGFRKGKVPMAYIEKMYGPAFFYEEAANIVMDETYAAAVEEAGVDVQSRPTVDIEQIEKGKDFIYTAEVAVSPEVTLGEYKGMEVEKAVIEVSDEEVQEALEAEAKKNSRIESVERPVEDGDTVILDFEGFVDGVAFDGGKGENYDLKIGSGSFIPGFEEALIGAELEKELDVNVTFPEDYQAEELKGKAATFKCTVHEIKVEVIPEIDDDFAEEVSEFDTLAEYKESIKADLLAKKEVEAKNAKMDAAVDKAVANATMEIADAMIDAKVDQRMDEFAQQMASSGFSMEQYFQITGASAESMKEELRPNVIKQIETEAVLRAIAAAEGIEVSEEELDAEYAKMAEQYGMEVEMVKSYVPADILTGDMLPGKAAQLVADAAVEA